MLLRRCRRFQLGFTVADGCGWGDRKELGAREEDERQLELRGQRRGDAPNAVAHDVERRTLRHLHSRLYTACIIFRFQCVLTRRVARGVCISVGMGMGANARKYIGEERRCMRLQLPHALHDDRRNAHAFAPLLRVCRKEKDGCTICCDPTCQKCV